MNIIYGSKALSTVFVTIEDKQKTNKIFDYAFSFLLFSIAYLILNFLNFDYFLHDTN